MNKKIIALSLASLLSVSAFAGTNVALVDLTQVFQQVPQGSAAFTALKQQLAPQVTQLQTSQQNLQKQETALQNNKKLSKDQIASQQAQLAAQSQALQQQIQSFQQSATTQEQALLTTFGNDVKTTVAQIAKQNDYDVVFSSQSVLYNTDGVDITSKVISNLQQQAPTASSSSSDSHNS